MNQSGDEVIVLGNGIGFNKSKNDIVDKDHVEKVFLLSDEKMTQFEQMVKNIPITSIQTSEKIISYAKESLRMELNDNIYISLTDHLNFAIERKKKGFVFQNAILWEIKRYYPKEFSIGQKAVEIVREDLKIDLPEDEAGFFALHIVNAELLGDTSQGMEMPEIIKDIVNMVKFSIGKNIVEKDISYDRFITHLKFFLHRVGTKQLYSKQDMPWATGIKESYPAAYKCTLRIQSYVKARLQYDTSEEEITYLTIHIQRMIDRSEKE